MRLTKTLSSLLLLLTLSFTAFSQDCADGPGLPGDDPDTALPCDVPLDNWVYMLVFAATVLGTYQLYKQQNSLTV